MCVSPESSPISEDAPATALAEALPLSSEIQSRSPRFTTRTKVFAIGSLVFLAGAISLVWLSNKYFLWPTPILLAVVLLLIAGVIAAYWLRWKWTGLVDYRIARDEQTEIHRGKSLWDWMQLLFIPIVLAGAAVFFNSHNSQVEHEIAADNQQEAMLQSYIDKMSELLLDKNLRNSQTESEVRNLAQTRTVTVLRRLDGERRGLVLQFLKSSGLISAQSEPTKPTIDLAEIDLSMTDLSQANMKSVFLSRAQFEDANFSFAFLDGSVMEETRFVHADLAFSHLNQARLAGASFDHADLFGADLSEADLTSANVDDANLTTAKLIRANLSQANLHNANLTNADLTGANLEGAVLDGSNLLNAKVTDEQLAKCRSKKGASLPNGAISN
jgi:uncharacterized protein YjbI with pentapeptide repeats